MTARAEELIRVLQTDEQLQSNLKAATTPQERKKVITDAGYGDVSSADVRATVANSGELSDEQLGAASGAGGIGIYLPGGFGGGIDW